MSDAPEIGRLFRRDGAVAWSLLAFLTSYTAWAWGGVRPSFHVVGVAVSVVLLAVVIVSGGGARQRWRRDPVMYLGAAFLGFLALQWANAGREQYFDVGFQRWMYTPPRWRNWPSAFSRDEARQMLAWFFPAWVIVTSIRTRLLPRRALRALLRFLVFNAAALAVFGVVQFVSGTAAIYWVQPLKEPFFASFGYGNHAAPFFVLAAALAAGLLYREAFDAAGEYGMDVSRFRLRHPGRMAGLFSALLLCLLGANLGLSRTGVILAAVLALFTAGYGWVRGWAVLEAAGRVNLAALTLAAAASLFFLVAGFGQKGLEREFAPKPVEAGTLLSTGERIQLELGYRPVFARAAISAWREQPWFGLGGWGFKYRVADHVPRNLWPALETRGWANVHVDFLQFLAEFGVVGFGLLAGSGAWMLAEWFHPRCRRHALWVMSLAGGVLLGGFSLVDIPFRSPAILYMGAVILAAVPQVCTSRSQSTSRARGVLLERNGL